MSKDKKLAQLVEEIRQEMPSSLLPLEGTRQFIENLLDEKLNAQAQEIVGAAKNKEGLTAASEVDLWDCLSTALAKALESQPADFLTVASAEYEQRLKLLAAEGNTGWVFIAPVKVDFNTFPATLLSTMQGQRSIVRCNGTRTPAVLSASLQSFGVNTIPADLAERCNDADLFLTTVKGSKETAFRKGLSSLNVAIDALRFSIAEASHFPSQAANSFSAADAQQEVFLLDLTGRKMERFNPRKRFYLGSLFSLENAKTRAEYDKVARLLEACPDNTPIKKQNDLIWRIARSARTFSRALEQHNRDLQFLLLLVGLEAILNRKDAPIAEALADYGALLTETEVAQRTKLAQELKEAYNLRSRFVHEGRIPSEAVGEDGLLQFGKVVFTCWKKIIQQLLELKTENLQTLKDDEFFKKLQQMKYGAKWPDVFSK